MWIKYRMHATSKWPKQVCLPHHSSVVCVWQFVHLSQENGPNGTWPAKGKNECQCLNAFTNIAQNLSMCSELKSKPHSLLMPFIRRAGNRLEDWVEVRPVPIDVEPVGNWQTLGLLRLILLLVVSPWDSLLRRKVGALSFSILGSWCLRQQMTKYYL